MTTHVGFALVVLLVGCAHGAQADSAHGAQADRAHGAPVLPVLESCATNPQLHQEKALELEALEKGDQADRSGPVESIDWKKVNARDLERRVQVAAIFAQGCLREAKDYLRAGLIYQHGDSADHFYQTFIWANQAVKLGDNSNRSLVALGIDRYLVKIGQKQLFGSQFSQDAVGHWCLEPAEKSFPEANRKKYLSMSLHDSIAFFLKFYASSQSVDGVRDCEHALKASPAGTVPGFW